MEKFQDDNLVIHGHRGCRGYRPENTIAAFLHAIDIGAEGLEMDVLCSADHRLVVSHDPFISKDHYNRFDGVEWTTGMEPVIFQLHSSQLKNFIRIPETQHNWTPQPRDQLQIPLLSEVVEAVTKYCIAQNKKIPLFNVEIKSREDWEQEYQPDLSTFGRIIQKEMDDCGIGNNCIIQSFDPRILTQLHEDGSSLPLVLLSQKEITLDQVRERLGFTPWGLSLLYIFVNESVIESCRNANVNLLTWTVNDPSESRRLNEMGVKYIISDYPDRVRIFVTTKSLRD